MGGSAEFLSAVFEASADTPNADVDAAVRALWRRNSDWHVVLKVRSNRNIHREVRRIVFS
jgi:hypothetical protein